MTGTAVNPLFRAAYLARAGDRVVTLVVPWLSLKDQELVYPNKITFGLPLDQEAYVRRWLEERAAIASGFNLSFYLAKVTSFGSFPSIKLWSLVSQTFVVETLSFGSL